MSEAWGTALRIAWTDLSHHAARNRQFRTRRLAPELSLDIYAALRAVDNAPCLLVPAPVPASALFEVGGMRLGSALGDDGTLLILSLEDLDRSDLFVTVCSDAVQAAALEGKSDSLAAFLARLDAWRRFLKERRTGLARHEVIGLIGELLILERILQVDPTLLATWTAPIDGLHDFERNGHALEVKSSAGVATSLRISTLDQLDDDGLRQLDLLHVRLIEAPDGRSLGQVVQAVADLLLDEAARRAFDNALLRRGLMPDDSAARTSPTVTLRTLTVFKVVPGFPRIVRAGLQAGIREVQYDLELRALDNYASDVEVVLSRFTADGMK